MWRYRDAGKYLEWCRRSREHILSGGSVQTLWPNEPLATIEDWRKEFLGALHRRINLKVGGLPTGRRWQDNYQTELRRDRAKLRDYRQRRIRIHQFATDICRRRFGHLIEPYEY